MRRRAEGVESASKLQRRRVQCPSWTRCRHRRPWFRTRRLLRLLQTARRRWQLKRRHDQAAITIQEVSAWPCRLLLHQERHEVTTALHLRMKLDVDVLVMYTRFSCPPKIEGQTLVRHLNLYSESFDVLIKFTWEETRLKRGLITEIFIILIDSTDATLNKAVFIVFSALLRSKVIHVIMFADWSLTIAALAEQVYWSKAIVRLLYAVNITSITFDLWVAEDI